MYLYRNRCSPIDKVTSNELVAWSSKAKLCDDIGFGSKCIIDCSPLGNNDDGKSFEGVKSQVVCEHNENADAYLWKLHSSTDMDDTYAVDNTLHAADLEEVCVLVADVRISKISQSKFKCSWAKSGSAKSYKVKVVTPVDLQEPEENVGVISVVKTVPGGVTSTTLEPENAESFDVGREYVCYVEAFISDS
eukprot:226963_1